MLNRNQIWHLVDDVLCATILFGVCALIILVPPRSAEDAASMTPDRKTQSSLPDSASSNLDSTKTIAVQGAFRELTN